MAQIALWKEERGIRGNQVCPCAKLLCVGCLLLDPSSCVPVSLTPPQPQSSCLLQLQCCYVRTYLQGRHGGSVFGAQSLRQMGTSGLGVKNNASEKDGVQPVGSKSLPTTVLESQRRQTFLSNLRSPDPK